MVDDAPRCADAAAAPHVAPATRSRRELARRLAEACHAVLLAVGGWLGACTRITHERTQAHKLAVAVATAQAHSVKRWRRASLDSSRTWETRARRRRTAAMRSSGAARRT